MIGLSAVSCVQQSVLDDCSDNNVNKAALFVCPASRDAVMIL